MKQGIYSIYDTKLQAYFSPFSAQNNQVAVRNYSDLANDTNSRINQHPNDYQLIRIGDWDDDNGSIKSCDHVNLGFASEYINGQITETPSG